MNRSARTPIFARPIDHPERFGDRDARPHAAEDSSKLMGAQSNSAEEINYDPEATDEDEWRETPHEVYLDAYRIARYPVTVGQYLQFIEDEAYQDERWWEAGGFGQFAEPQNWEGQIAYPSRPAVHVSWYEAAVYSAWAGVRLLTEAEWERAARGTEGRKYPWGDETPISSRVNFSDSHVGHPSPVGIFPLDVTPERIHSCRSGRRSGLVYIHSTNTKATPWRSSSSPFRFKTARQPRSNSILS